MLVSKLIPQVDPHVKIGSAKVSRKKTRKDYTFSLKLAKSQKVNFEQPPYGRDPERNCWELVRCEIAACLSNARGDQELLSTRGRIKLPSARVVFLLRLLQGRCSFSKTGRLVATVAFPFFGTIPVKNLKKPRGSGGTLVKTWRTTWRLGLHEATEHAFRV